MHSRILASIHSPNIVDWPLLPPWPPPPIISGKARYDWGHAIAGGVVTFKDQTILRERRVSLIFRNLTENDIFLKAYEKKRGATLTNVWMPCTSV